MREERREKLPEYEKLILGIPGARIICSGFGGYLRNAFYEIPCNRFAEYIQQREQAGAQAERARLLKVAYALLNEPSELKGLRRFSVEVEMFLGLLKQRLESK